MFIAEADKTELRQGDVIAAVWFPRIRFEDIRLVAPVDHTIRDRITAAPDVVPDRDMEWTVAQIQMARRNVMVLSQCCDLERTHGKPRGLAVVVAPLVPVPERYRRKPEVFEALRANSLDKYYNLFYIEQHAPLSSDFIVDFGRVVSVGLDQYEQLLDQKLLQLTDQARIALKSKVAFNFGRLTEEEEAAGFTLSTPAALAQSETGQPAPPAETTTPTPTEGHS